MPILLCDTRADAASAAILWPGGAGRFRASGPFDGACVRLEIRHSEDAPWLTLEGTQLHEESSLPFVLHQGWLRAVATGAAHQTCLTASVMAEGEGP